MKPVFKRTEVGVIPADWQLRPMLAAVRVASGQVDPKIEPYRSMILVAPDHIERGSGRLLKKETARDQRAISGKYLFAPGDIVYSKIRPYLRKAILTDFEGLCSADMYPFTPAADMSAGFLFAAILGHDFSKYADSVSIRSGMPKINRVELSEYTFAIPPTKDEQEAIAEALSDVDALIGALDQLVTKKRHLKQAAMQQLLSGKQRLPGFNKPWGVQQLGTLAQIVNGGTPKTAVADYWNGSINWCTPTDVTRCLEKYLLETERTISYEGLATCSAQLLPVGSLLLCSRATIGEIRLAGCALCTNQGFKSLICKQGVSNEFLYYKLLTMKPQMVERAIGSTFLEISKKQIALLEISIPEEDEQTTIATVLSDMDVELAALEQKRDKTRALKQGMMQELLTGKTRLI